MIGTDECVDALMTIVNLPSRSSISELMIRPIMLREAAETADFP